MSTKLNDGNIKKIIGLMAKEGYRKAFWQEYRAHAANGSGVGKAMDKLQKLGVPKNGDPSNAKIDQMKNITSALEDLTQAFLKAKGKCGGGQKQTKKLCEAYLKRTEILYIQARTLVEDTAATPGGPPGPDPKVVQANAKAMTEAAKKYANWSKYLVAVQQMAAKAHKELTSKMDAWMSQRDREGGDAVRLDTAMEQAIKKLAQDFKIKPSYEGMKKTGAEIASTNKVLGKIKPDGLDKKLVSTAGQLSKKAGNDYKAAHKAMETFLPYWKKSMQEVVKHMQLAIKAAKKEEPVEGH